MDAWTVRNCTKGNGKIKDIVLLPLRKRNGSKTYLQGDHALGQKENKMKKITKVICNLDIAIASAALLVLIIITFTDVIMRYFFDNPFIWKEEMQMLLLNWTVYLGAGYAFVTGNHVAIELLVDYLPTKAAKVIEMLDTVLVIAILIYLAIQGTGIVNQYISTGRYTNILHIPYGLIYAVVPIGSILMIVRFAVVQWNHFKGKDHAEENLEEMA